MPANWLRIGRTDFFLKSDRLNWIVARRDKGKKSKVRPDGHKYTDLTYHDKLSGAFERIFDETVKLAEVKSIHEIQRACKETYDMLKEVLDYDFKERKSAA